MSAEAVQQNSSTVGSTTLVNLYEQDSYLEINKVITIPFFGYWFELSFGANNVFICYRIFNYLRQSLFYGIDMSSNEFNDYVKEQKMQPDNITNIFIYRLLSRSVNNYLNNNEEHNIEALSKDTEHLDLIKTFVNYVINMNMYHLDSLNTFDQHRIEFIQKLNEISIIPEGIVSEFDYIINNTIRLHVQHILESDINTNDFWKPVDIHISNDVFENKLTHRRMSKKIQKEFGCNNTCTICLEDIRPNQFTTITECKHVFHKKCAKEWFTKKCNTPICPCCRTDIRENK